MYAIITITVVAIIVLFLGAIEKKRMLLPILFPGLGVALGLSFTGWNQAQHYFNDMYIGDNFSIAFNAVLISSTCLVFMFVPVYYKTVNRSLEDIYALILFAMSGGLMMTSFGNLVMLFLGIETLSISLYILAGSKKFDPKSNEAAMKYFLIGSFASGFLLFGMALLYGASGSFNLSEIRNYVHVNQVHLPVMFVFGLLLVVIGMTFKIGAAPFHFWAPDVYHGSPTLVTTFMATVGKVAAIAALYRLMNSCFVEVGQVWNIVLVVFVVATIVIGNFTALYQDNVKRMLAYSGIAHAGYMLIALVVIKASVAGVLLLYSVSYAISTITAFAVLMFVREKRGAFLIPSFNGLARQYPREAFAMTVAMLSLAGIPPLIGFAAKYRLFIKAIEGGHLPLVIVAVVGSMVSIYYYFRPVVAMYLNSAEDNVVVKTSGSYRIPILIATVLMIILGFIPGLIVDLI